VTPWRIAVLWHERDRGRDLQRYAITHLADHWRNDGHAVRFVFGVNRFEAADIVIVHVDLTIVPARYLDFAARYPIAVNGRVQDIRRTTFSRNLVRLGDGYAGPVIVKSNYNYAGRPDRVRAGVAARLCWQVRRRMAVLLPRSAGALPLFNTPRDYRIFERAADVPPAWYQCSDLVVERFLPEREADAYVVRNYQFLGDRWTCQRMIAPHPIVNASTHVAIEPVEPDPAIERFRLELGFDYGKFDYVMHAGQAVLLDANKTTGAGGMQWTPALDARRRHRAEGLYSFFS
jgi:hypothetical protein